MTTMVAVVAEGTELAADDTKAAAAAAAAAKKESTRSPESKGEVLKKGRPIIEQSVTNDCL